MGQIREWSFCINYLMMLWMILIGSWWKLCVGERSDDEVVIKLVEEAG